MDPCVHVGENHPTVAATRSPPHLHSVKNSARANIHDQLCSASLPFLTLTPHPNYDLPESVAMVTNRRILSCVRICKSLTISRMSIFGVILFELICLEGILCLIYL
jgi:hypothetical protein